MYIKYCFCIPQFIDMFNSNFAFQFIVPDLFIVLKINQIRTCLMLNL